MMYHDCPKTCNVCHDDADGYCRDGDPDVCFDYEQDGWCIEPAVMKYCPETCGICSHVCEDHPGQNCKERFKKDHCDDPESIIFMYAHCPASCGICAKLEENIARLEPIKKNIDDIHELAKTEMMLGGGKFSDHVIRIAKSRKEAGKMPHLEEPTLPWNKDEL